jgi:hypothetical protein
MERLKRFTETPAAPIAPVLGAPAREQKSVLGALHMSRACGSLIRRIGIVDPHIGPRSIDLPVEGPLAVLVDQVNVGTLWTLGGIPILISRKGVTATSYARPCISICVNTT